MVKFVIDSLINCHVAYCFSMDIGFFIFTCYVEWYLLIPFHNIKELVLIFTVSNRSCPKGKKKHNTADSSVGAASST